MSGGTPGCESRYGSGVGAVAPVESTVGTRVCAITSVGPWAPLLPADRPHTSSSAGPALTTSLLPLILAGIAFTCTPFVAADVRSREASKVSDPVACEIVPKLTGPETPWGREAGISTGNPDCAAAAAASVSWCSVGASGSHLTSP